MKSFAALYSHITNVYKIYQIKENGEGKGGKSCEIKEKKGSPRLLIVGAQK